MSDAKPKPYTREELKGWSLTARAIYDYQRIWATVEALGVAVRERDVLREKQAAWLASPEAAARLAGYGELGDKCATLERERDEARAVNNRALTGMGQLALRLDAEVARAREEQRAACVAWAESRFWEADSGDCTWDNALEVVEATPLTTTPLADRIAELEAAAEVTGRAYSNLAEEKRQLASESKTARGERHMLLERLATVEAFARRAVGVVNAIAGDSRGLVVAADTWALLDEARKVLP